MKKRKINLTNIIDSHGSQAEEYLTIRLRNLINSESKYEKDKLDPFLYARFTFETIYLKSKGKNVDIFIPYIEMLRPLVGRRG